MNEPIEEQVAARHLTSKQLSGRTIFPGHIVADLASVVDECRALRVERDLNLHLTPVVQRIGQIRKQLEVSHDTQEQEAYLARMVLVAQMQILDTVLTNIERIGST